MRAPIILMLFVKSETRLAQCYRRLRRFKASGDPASKSPCKRYQAPSWYICTLHWRQLFFQRPGMLRRSVSKPGLACLASTAGRAILFRPLSFPPLQPPIAISQ
ncbi:hypothetical protein CYLTODRAFT_118656 [Cylindrobasidium torrendii FP15055 ss-10]|uniref:Uncharacterized protein n=1 Tax=Cylindrobasidium torrendii FP15055 ss-10 TaxID=1314674 RepID=A0A0D7BN07_9AGAR|nr:hypothetical protein CYLTODRAFT_118656 [Cylindrobasidium torrendii FP15055 ss-10]